MQPDSHSNIVVETSDIVFSYGDKRIINGVSLTLRRGQVLVLMGPSGCGKSTMVRVLAGLEAPESGTVNWHAIKNDTSSDRLRLVFQDFDGFPWLTVEQNLRFGSGPKPYPSSGEVTKLLGAVGLIGSEHMYPAELSGGMRKRLALARAIVRRPELLILDEPFVSLDVATKSAMYELLNDLILRTQCAVLLVSHDPHEALVLGNEILVMSQRPMRLTEAMPNLRPARLSEWVDVNAANLDRLFELLRKPQSGSVATSS